MTEVTHVLAAIEQGDPHAAEQLPPLVYDELRRIAAHRLAQDKPGETLQVTGQFQKTPGTALTCR
jgi:ECF sigma factor